MSASPEQLRAALTTWREACASVERQRNVSSRAEDRLRDARQVVADVIEAKRAAADKYAAVLEREIAGEATIEDVSDAAKETAAVEARAVEARAACKPLESIVERSASAEQAARIRKQGASAQLYRAVDAVLRPPLIAAARTAYALAAHRAQILGALDHGDPQFQTGGDSDDGLRATARSVGMRPEWILAGPFTMTTAELDAELEKLIGGAK